MPRSSTPASSRSAALARRSSSAIADTRGVKVRYLFNLFDYWGAIVTSRDSVKTLKDIEGKEIAAARSTTNYQMFEFFAKRQGVDIAKFKVVNTATAGLVSYAIADRADAIQIWEPAYTLLMAKKPSIRTLDLGIAKAWKDFAQASERIPYLGVAAHAEWADAESRTGEEALRHLQGRGRMDRRSIRMKRRR